MELNFSKKGLLTFDASTIVAEAEADGSAWGSVTGAASSVRSLDISRNSLHTFCGGERLKWVTLLNLSYNALKQLDGRSLPPNLVKLVISHNHLTELPHLADYTQKLEELDAGSNELQSAGLVGLPPSIAVLNISSNRVESLQPLTPLARLAKLNVAGNRLRRVEDIQIIYQLRSLRQLDVRDNELLTQTGAEAAVVDLLPRLSILNGTPLAQTAGNRMYKAAQAMRPPSSEAKVVTAAATTSGAPRIQVHPPSARQSDGPRHAKGETPLEIRLMEVKIKELERMQEDLRQQEQETRQQRNMLAQQSKACGQVQKEQEAEIIALEQEIDALRVREAGLKDPVAELDQTFEQTHASLLAQKVGPTPR